MVRSSPVLVLAALLITIIGISYVNSQAARRANPEAIVREAYPNDSRDSYRGPRDPRERDPRDLRDRDPRELRDRDPRELPDPRDNRYPPQPAYSSPMSQPGYPAESYPARSHHPSQQPGFPPQQGYPPGSTYPQGYPPSDRRFPSSSGSGYDSGYGSTASYPPSSGRSSVRTEPNYIYNDSPGDYSPQGHYGQSGGYPGGPPQRDPRAAQGFPPYVSAAPDVAMGGVPVDDSYYSQAPSVQARAGFPPSRGTPLGGYDPTPQPRDTQPPMDGYRRR